MKKIELEELKKIQLDILSSIDSFCRRYYIKYSMGCGTLLGAIRHKGYIPWDDDIDIYMLREDYNKFESLFPEVLEGHLCLANHKRNPDMWLPFAKVYDNRTIVFEKRSKSFNPGVNVDVFIIDDVPDDDSEWESYNKKRRQMMIKLRRSGLKISSINDWKKNIGAIIFKFQYLFLDRDKLVEDIIEYAQKFNGKGFKRVFETTSGMNVKKPFKKALFDNIIDLPFEDRYFKGFADYDEYLTCTFGDYMTPPPPEKRVSFHTFDAYWK